MATKEKTCYIYTRVSTAVQIDGYSLEAQRDRLMREAAHRGYKVTGEYSDEGHSGKNIKGRPAFVQMLDDIRNAKDRPDYVYVFKLSRFGRNAADTLESLQFLEDFGVSLLCVEDGIDSKGAAGKLLIAVYAAVAEAERENIHVQTMAGRWAKAKDGGWNGGFAPYGYKLEGGQLQVAEDEADLIRAIFDLYAGEHIGMNGIAKRLNAQGFRKKIRNNANTDRIGQSFVKAVLDNPVYAGYLPYGRRKTEKIDGTRNEFHVVRQSEYSLFEGKHEALISREQWAQVRAKREASGYVREKTHSLEHAHVLSGILRCPECGAPMYGNVNRKRKKDGSYYKDTWYYVCKHRIKVDGKSCSFKGYVRQDDINADVFGIVRQIFDRPCITEMAAKDFLGSMTDVGKLEDELEKLSKHVKDLKGRKTKLLGKIAEMDAEDPLYDEMYESYNGLIRGYVSELADVEQQMEDLNEQIACNGARKQSVEAICDAVSKMWERGLENMPDELIRQFLHEFIDKVGIMKEPVKADGQTYWLKSITFKVPFAQGTPEEHDTYEFNYQPNEGRVETVCLLESVKGQPHIDFTLDIEELSKTPRSTATYPEIKAYVQDKYGFKVSSLYIGQIKTKCGLEKRENFNKGEGKSKELICPPEKEEAIKDAFRHFGMLE